MFFETQFKFSVLLEGANLLMDLQDPQRFGFFTTRYVKAANGSGFTFFPMGS